MVAINGVEEGANPEVVKAELTQHEVFVEGYGGNTPFVLISGKTGKGVDSLLETILLLAELEELPYLPDDVLEAPIIEAKLDPKRGVLVSAIIKKGTLHLGDMVRSNTQRQSQGSIWRSRLSHQASYSWLTCTDLRFSDFASGR